MAAMKSPTRPLGGQHPVPGAPLLRLAARLAAGLGLSLPSTGATPFTVDWIQGPGGVSVAADSAGNAFTVRYDYNPAGDIRLVKHDPEGGLLWDGIHDQTDPAKWERAECVACDPAGNAIVCGTLMSGYSSPVRAASILMKFTPSGSLAWRKVFDGPFDGSSTRRCLTDGDGNIYVFGLGMSPAGMVTRVKSFAPDGTVRWDWFDTAGIGAPLHFKFTPDRALLMTCRSVTGSFNGHAKIDLQGNTIWTLPGIPSIPAGDAAGDLSGNTYLVHGSAASGGGTVLRKLDPQGLGVWSVSHPFSAFRVEVGSDARPVACGFSQPNTGGAAFVKFDGADGSVVWENLNADGPQNLLLHSQLLIDSENHVYLAAGVLTQMAVCKVNQDGSDGWLSLAGMGSAASGIALSRNGRILATGGETVQISQPWVASPAVLTVRTGEGAPHVSLAAEPGRTYRIETTGDFDRWQPVCTMLLHGPVQGFQDSGASSAARRFYRAVAAD